VEKQVMYHISKFIKQQWLGTILIVLFILFLVYGIGKNSDLQKEKQRLEKEIEVLEQKEELHWNKLDSLKVSENTIIKKEKILIQIQHDTIKIIDTMSVSELQKYFTNRYNKKDSIR
jgi:cell division protein FtsB